MVGNKTDSATGNSRLPQADALIDFGAIAMKGQGMSSASILKTGAGSAAYLVFSLVSLLSLNAHAAGVSPTVKNGPAAAARAVSSTATSDFTASARSSAAAATTFVNSKFDLTAIDDDDCGDAVMTLGTLTAVNATEPDLMLATIDGDRTDASKGGATAAPSSTASKNLRVARIANTTVKKMPLAVATSPLPVQPVAPSWEMMVSDKTLNAALARWAAAAGWQLLWELPVDYAVEAHTTVPGSFEDAVSTVVESMAGAEIPMKAVFYQGNKVLRVTAKGAE